jgi:hypothetical protein
VQAYYNTSPDLKNADAPLSAASYFQNMAGEIGADYTYYDKQTGEKKGGLPGELLIKNEGAKMKGTF